MISAPEHLVIRHPSDDYVSIHARVELIARGTLTNKASDEAMVATGGVLTRGAAVEFAQAKVKVELTLSFTTLRLG